MEIISPSSTDTHAIKRQHANHNNSSPAPDLFDTLEHWLDSPELAYSSWTSGQRLEDSTKRVYIAMFSRFCEWLNGQGRKLDHLEARDIRQFLDSINPNLPESRQHAQTGRQRQQYVRQLERVFAHLGALGRSGGNPGRMAGFEKVGSGSDKPTRFLSSEESRAVMVLLKERLGELKQDEKGIDAWMDYRDLALISVMIGAGLKVGHVAGLTLNCIDMVEERIDLSQKGYTHRARMLAFAVEPIQAWLSFKARMNIGGTDPQQEIFVADRSSGFGRLSKKATLSASSIHRRTQRFLEAAGITGERASAQTLRNTYAGLLIEGGASDEQLIDYLGLKASITAQRLRLSFAKSRAGIDETQNSLLETAA